jgi:dynein heavy chain
MRSFNQPPTAVEHLFEAVCILFSKQPSLLNFRKLSGGGDFLSLLIHFKIECVSDYAFKQVTKYFENADFNFDYISKISTGAGTLFKWFHNVYEYAKYYSLVNALNTNLEVERKKDHTE